MMTNIRIERVLPACVAFVAACLMGTSAIAASASHGKTLVEANCGKCHATGFEDESAHPDAPPFRALWERLPDEEIDPGFLARIEPAHPDMPRLILTPVQAADISAYLSSLQPVAHGKALVEENCAACHAVGETGESPHSDAPPFRILSQRYPLDALEEAFVEGIETGHPDMPSFVATPNQIADILTWIATIQEK